MEMLNALREKDTSPSTLKKDALPDVIFNVASLVVVSGISEGEAAFVSAGESVREQSAMVKVGTSLS